MLNSYTHTEMLQVGRRFSGNALAPSYRDAEKIEFVRAVYIFPVVARPTVFCEAWTARFRKDNRRTDEATTTLEPFLRPLLFVSGCASDLVEIRRAGACGLNCRFIEAQFGTTAGYEILQRQKRGIAPQRALQIFERFALADESRADGKQISRGAIARGLNETSRRLTIRAIALDLLDSRPRRGFARSATPA